MKNKKIEDNRPTGRDADPPFRRRPFRFVLDKIIYPTSLYFTLATLALYIGGTAFGTVNQNMIPTLRTELLVLALCLIFNAANLILTAKKLHMALRIAIHYVITALSFFILFINTSENKPGGSLTIILLLVYSVIYAAVAVTFFSVNSAARRSKNDKSEYESIYDRL